MTAFNPAHYRKTWLALGNPTDPVAFDVAGSHSAISLLKGILAEFGFPFIPGHSISFDKLQQVVGPTVLGRGAGLGDVLPLSLGRGLQITGTTLQATADVPLLNSNNTWTGTNAFNGGLTTFDRAKFSIINESDTSKVLRFDCSTMPTGNTLQVRMPSVGLDGSGTVGYLGLLKDVGNAFAQPASDNLTALSSLAAVNTIYYRSQDNPAIWSPVVIGANLLFNQGTLSATGGGGGGGGVSTAGPVNASMLTAFADASGTLIQGVMVAGPGITYASGLLQTSGDLRALELLTGTNTIYYRAADAVWNAVTIGTGLVFNAGALGVSAVLGALAGLATVADTVPYFTAPNVAALTAFTTFGRSLVGTADAAAARTLIGAQPLDDDLTAISNLTGTNTIYYRSGVGNWSPVTIGTNLAFAGGILSATGGAGGGVSTSGPVTAAMLTGYADATGLLIRGITLPGAGLTLTGAALTFANDLAALEALTGTNTIYYRSGVDAWSAVTIGTNLTFAGGVLSAAAGGGGVSTSGAVTASMLTGYADSTGTLIRGINLPAAGIALAGTNLVLTNDLASLESASATGAMYYRSAADTWSTVTVGGGLGFTGPNLTITNVALTALGALTPAADRLPYFTGPTTAALATFTAAGRTLVSQPDAASMVGVLGAQPLDGDLTSLASATGTDTIYYRSGVSTWSPVVIGTNLTFSGGTLAATGAGGDVFKNLPNTFTAANTFTAQPVFLEAGMNVRGVAGNSFVSMESFSPSPPDSPSTIFLSRSRGGTIGAHVAVAAGDTLGMLRFAGSNGTAYAPLALISASARSATTGSLSFWTHNGGTIAERMRLYPGGGLAIDSAITDGGAGVLTADKLFVYQPADTSSQGLAISNAAKTSIANIFMEATLLKLHATGGVGVYSNGDTTNPLILAQATGVRIKGRTDATAPAAGYIGELVQASTGGGGVVIPASTGYTVAAITLGGGDWDIWGIIGIGPGQTAASAFTVLSIGNIPNAASGVLYMGGYADGAGAFYFGTPQLVARVTGSQAWYLNATPNQNMTVPAGGATIFARRRA